MFTQFYNETIRNTVVAFGSLFNEIYIKRQRSDGTDFNFKVPITYAPKEKFIRMLDEYTKLKDQGNPIDISDIIPRIGFNIDTMNYDSERKRTTISKRYFQTNSNSDIDFEYAEVPYTIDFSLSITTRTMDDALQILEQVLAYFSPDFTVTVNFSERHRRVDVPITLTGVATEVDFEGDTSTQRSIIFTLSFEAKTFIYGPKKSAKIIKKVDASIQEMFGDYNNEVARLIGVPISDGVSGDDVNQDNYTNISILGSTTDRKTSIFEQNSREFYSHGETFPPIPFQFESVVVGPENYSSFVSANVQVTGGFFEIYGASFEYYWSYLDPMDNVPDISDDSFPQTPQSWWDYDPCDVRIGAGSNNTPYDFGGVQTYSPNSVHFMTSAFFSAESDITDEEYQNTTDEEIRNRFQAYINSTDPRINLPRSSYLNENTTGLVIVDIEHPMNFLSLGDRDGNGNPIKTDEEWTWFTQGIIRRLKILREFIPNAKIGIWRFGDVANSGVASAEENHIRDNLFVANVEYEGTKFYDAIDFISPVLYQYFAPDGTPTEINAYNRIVNGGRTSQVKNVVEALYADMEEVKPIVVITSQDYEGGSRNNQSALTPNSIEASQLINEEVTNMFVVWYATTGELSRLESYKESFLDELTGLGICGD